MNASTIRNFDFKKHFLVFTHIPKCGGTSVHDCLQRMLGDRYAVKSPALPATSLDSSLWGMGGHFSFGRVPEHILNGRTPVYMTILREPVSRVLSFYRHVVVRPEHKAYKLVPNFHDLSPIEVLRTWNKVLPGNVRNLQTQMICNLGPSQATANKAIDILVENYRFVALLDSLEEMIGELAEFLGVERPMLPKLNVSTVDESEFFKNSAFIEEIKSLNQKDILLYRHVAFNKL